MPTINQLRVVVGERGESGLMIGDVVTIRSQSGTVRGMRELNTNMEVTLDTGTRRVPLGKEINVLRQIATPEEELAVDVERLTDQADQAMNYSGTAMERKFTKLATSYAEQRQRNILYPFDLDLALEMAKVQEDVAIIRSMFARIDAMRESNPEFSEDSLVARAVVVTREECRRVAMAPYRSVLSRSTSVASNLTEDLRREAAVTFIDNTRWWDAESVLERILARDGE